MWTIIFNALIIIWKPNSRREFIRKDLIFNTLRINSQLQICNMKKILPKNTIPALSAADMEASFQKSTSVKTEPSITHYPLPIITEGGVKAIPTSKREGRSRISIDIPDELYALVESHKEETGQTMTHLVVSLMKKFFAEKNKQN